MCAYECGNIRLILGIFFFFFFFEQDHSNKYLDEKWSRQIWSILENVSWVGTVSLGKVITIFTETIKFGSPAKLQNSSCY